MGEEIAYIGMDATVMKRDSAKIVFDASKVAELTLLISSISSFISSLISDRFAGHCGQGGRHEAEHQRG